MQVHAKYNKELYGTKLVIITSSRSLLIDTSRCTGCRSCEMACSLYHEGECSPVLSRIRIVKYEALGRNFPSACSQCSKPRCLEACDHGAIRMNESTGAVFVEESFCTGCRSCLVACPFMGFHPVKKVAFKCDLCGGDPQCVRFCPSGAITFRSVDEFLMERRREMADKVILAAQE
ncbi:4Fe-4S dicluster domain-containing protein [Methanosarcina sp. MSH10X1]|uniref:4Fe-4S dicluster domain-containing protein n=1 Tax=Methanosarcina sp. MSH10X1 TaxID=2507075 RepID=UPI0035115D2C